MEDYLYLKDLFLPLVGITKKMTTMKDEEWEVLDVITEISSTHGYKNSTSSNSNEVIHNPELISQHSKKVKNYSK